MPLSENHHHHTLDTDVLIIGAGAAGCRAAIEAASQGARALIVTQGRLGYHGSSFYPLTPALGFTTAYPDSPEEAEGIGFHFEQIMAAGQGMVSPLLARKLAEEAPRQAAILLDTYHLSPLSDDSGRIRWIKPDYGSGSVCAFGASISALRDTFSCQVGRHGIEVLEDSLVVRLLGSKEGCQGAITITAQGQMITVNAGATILASGGYAALFDHHLTSAGLLGSGYSLALDLGAELINLEFYQLILGITFPIKKMLIAESLLEAQPKITNVDGQEFLAGYLPADASVRACLTERAHTGPFHTGTLASHIDVAMFHEIIADRDTHGGVVCDFTSIPWQELGRLSPNWYEWALSRGTDLTESPVSVAPHVHADNGGVLIDTSAATAVPGLYACGEAAGGPHGANRIGGNQMIGTQVFGAIAGAEATTHARQAGKTTLPADEIAQIRARMSTLMHKTAGAEPRHVLKRIQRAMYLNLGVEKTAGSLERARLTLEEIRTEIVPELYAPPGQLQLAMALPRALEIAGLIVRSATLRQESRGPHYRSDYPKRDDARYGRPIVWKKDAEQPAGYHFRTFD